MSDDVDNTGFDNVDTLSDMSGDVGNAVPSDLPADIPEDVPDSGGDGLTVDAASDDQEEIPEDLSQNEENPESKDTSADSQVDNDSIDDHAEKSYNTTREYADTGGTIESNEKPFDSNPYKEDGTLKENIRYQTGEFGYKYETDERGRISDFHADELHFTEREKRLPNAADTPGKLEGDQAGHLAGDRFGGSSEIDNLVSQSSHVNLSEYKKIENQWATALEKGQHVSTNVGIEYEQNDMRPSAFNVDYEVDGEAFSQRILNRKSIR